MWNQRSSRRRDKAPLKTWKGSLSTTTGPQMGTPLPLNTTSKSPQSGELPRASQVQNIQVPNMQWNTISPEEEDPPGHLKGEVTMASAYTV